MERPVVVNGHEIPGDFGLGDAINAATTKMAGVEKLIDDVNGPMKRLRHFAG